MSTEPDIPAELANMFVSELASNAMQLHELYQEQVRAGFTSNQSIYIVGCILTGNPGPAPESPSTD